MSAMAVGDVSAALSGCYDASRAAALSGVPKSTVYDWARKGVVVPTVSPVQEKLWSYADLMALRIVVWLRQPSAADLRRSSPMSNVRRALEQINGYGLDIWSDNGDFSHRSPILVDQRGAIFLQLPDGTFDLRGNRALPQVDHFALTGPFLVAGQSGPDLIRPRRHLRIVPDKVAGEPHVQGTRLTTRTLAALVDRGFDQGQVAEMYTLSREIVGEAVELEHELMVA